MFKLIRGLGRKFLNDNKRIFIESINQQKLPNFINNISKPTTITKLKQTAAEPKAIVTETFDREQRPRRKSKSYIFKISTFVLLILWIGTLVFFLFFSNTENDAVKIQQQESQIPIVEPPKAKAEPVPTKELNPKPNSKLNKTDYTFLSKKITKGMRIKDIVQIIFNSNPTDIGKTYSTQSEEYCKQIIDSNKDCFRQDSFEKGTLTNIPSYKNGK